VSRTGRSLVGFGAYAMVMGAGLYLAPDRTLDVLLTPRTSEHWIRLLGASAMVLGGYYAAAGRADDRRFARWSLRGRLALAASFALLVARGLAPVLLLGIAGNELLGVLWTWRALQTDARAAAAPRTAA
jgi:hypothetical protein